MEAQLTLLDTDTTDWRLDEATREAGRRGIEQARAVLQAARRPGDDHNAHNDPAERRAA